MRNAGGGSAGGQLDTSGPRRLLPLFVLLLLLKELLLSLYPKKDNV